MLTLLLLRESCSIIHAQLQESSTCVSIVLGVEISRSTMCGITNTKQLYIIYDGSTERARVITLHGVEGA